MLTIAIDMDGVMADIYKQFQKYHFNEFGEFVEESETIDKTEYQAFKNLKKHIREKDFFRNIPVMNNSVEVLEQLNKVYKIFIVTAAMEFPLSLEAKFEWLAENFPFLSWKQFVFCGEKTMIDAYFMIDDHLKNLDPFKGKTLLFTQPHNCKINNTIHRRVNNWSEIKNLLLP